jgi:hypothetical protein
MQELLRMLKMPVIDFFLPRYPHFVPSIESFEEPGRNFVIQGLKLIVK